jgi:hypothetical protein
VIHQHKDVKGNIYGHPHPVKSNHKKPLTQCAHLRVLAMDKVISWTEAADKTEAILAKVKEEERLLRRCPGCGIGKHGVDALCDRCYKEYLGTHVGARSAED